MIRRLLLLVFMLTRKILQKKPR